MPADDDFLFGAGERHVQQTQVFGGLAVGVGQRAELPRHAGMGMPLPRHGMGMPLPRLAARHSQHYAALRVEAHGSGRAAPVLVSGIGDDDERELQPFGFVDSHQLHGAAHFGWRLALARAHVTQRVHVIQEVVHGDEAAAVRVGQQFVHVAAQALTAARRFQNRAVVGEVEEALEQLGDGEAVGEGMEGSDGLGGWRKKRIGRFA